MKDCGRCLKKLGQTEFGNSSWCKQCHRDYAKNHHIDNWKYRRDRQLQRRFGITQKEYDQMYADQDGRCFICRLSETKIDSRTGKAQNLCVDHSHETGKVRKLLCNRCNTALGLMEENVELYKQHLSYIEIFQYESTVWSIRRLP